MLFYRKKNRDKTSSRFDRRSNYILIMDSAWPAKDLIWESITYFFMVRKLFYNITDDRGLETTKF